VEIRSENHHSGPENIVLLIEANTRLKEENVQLKISLEESEKRISLLIEQIKLNKLR
jgi:hypothetical protein